jgi:hypothetical protein
VIAAAFSIVPVEIRSPNICSYSRTVCARATNTDYEGYSGHPVEVKANYR